MKIYEIKEQQNKLAKKIKELKSTRKQVPYGRVPGLEQSSDIFRHRHIAYCLARGRTYQQIDQKGDEPPNK